MYYVAHRLFAAHDRVLAAGLADRLASEVGADSVFLPFCDTDEEDLADEVKGRRIFDLDRARLRRLTAVIAILHGPSLDDGVCMEIGYASALGTPVAVLTSDFQTYSLTESGPRMTFPDPLVEYLASRIVRVERLGPPPPVPGGSRFEVFAERNRVQIERVWNETAETILGMTGRGTTNPPPPARIPRRSFIEPSPYGTAAGIGTALVRAGYETRAATRLDSAAPGAARSDWDTALASELLLADVSGPETPPGAAVLIGAAAALGRRIVAYQPRPSFTHARGREPNWRNLMIQYASCARVGGIGELTAWLAS